MNSDLIIHEKYKDNIYSFYGNKEQLNAINWIILALVLTPPLDSRRIRYAIWLTYSFWRLGFQLLASILLSSD
jgi:hypothetical protein